MLLFQIKDFQNRYSLITLTIIMDLQQLNHFHHQLIKKYSLMQKQYSAKLKYIKSCQILPIFLQMKQSKFLLGTLTNYIRILLQHQLSINLNNQKYLASIIVSIWQALFKSTSQSKLLMGNVQIKNATVLKGKLLIIKIYFEVILVPIVNFNIYLFRIIRTIIFIRKLINGHISVQIINKQSMTIFIVNQLWLLASIFIFFYQSLTSNMAISFSYNGVSDIVVPNLFYNTFQILVSEQELKEAIRNGDIIKNAFSLENQKNYYKNTINDTFHPQIYIGFYSLNSIELTIQFRLGQEVNFINIIKNNLFLIILLSLNVMLAICFLMMQMYQTGDRQHVIPAVVQQRAVKKGFSQKILEKFFQGYEYNGLIQVYMGLKEVEECVICLEPIKLENVLVSVTPCFHIFHEDCLQKWLLNAKHCAYCRKKFKVSEMEKIFPWIKMNIQSVRGSGKGDGYIERMKKRQKQDLEESSNQTKSISEMPNKSSMNLIVSKTNDNFQSYTQGQEEQISKGQSVNVQKINTLVPRQNKKKFFFNIDDETQYQLRLGDQNIDEKCSSLREIKLK